jgi:hypothetical protein
MRRAPCSGIVPVSALACAALLCCACHRPTARVLSAPSGGDLVRYVVSERIRLGPVTATFSGRMKRRPGWFPSASVTGVLAMHPPDRFRIKLFLPAGLTAQDLTMVGRRYRLVRPLEDRDEGGAVCFATTPECNTATPGIALAWLFTHDLQAHADASIVTTHGDHYIVSTELDRAQDLQAVLTLAREDRRLLTEEMFLAGQRWARVDFSEHRPVGGVLAPHRIRIADDRAGVSVVLDVDGYRQRADLPAELFRLP